jgi:glycosyltransferase involved in cell wall biosynthesis
MKIAIDALGIAQPGGGRTATLNLLTSLFRIDGENQYLVFLDEPEAALAVPNVQQQAVGLRGRFAARVWAQLVLPIALRRAGVDLVHHVKNLGTFGNPGRTVVTVYDLSVLSQADIYPLSDRLYWRWIEPATLRQAHRIIAISQCTAQDISAYYHIGADKIDTVYPGYDPAFCLLPAADVARIRQKYRLPDRFLLHVGSISRKKNLTPVVRAMVRLAQLDPTASLVLAGRIYGKAFDHELFQVVKDRETADRIVMLGPVPPGDLPGLYNCATAVVYPSLQEGFGLVALEAMACGTPVITSGSGAIGEVVGDAAIIVSSSSDDTQWSAAMEQVLADPDRRERLRHLGLARARLFSNEEGARQTLDVYRRAMGTS